MNIIRDQLAQAGLTTPACHGYWNDFFIMACRDLSHRADCLIKHREFIQKLADFKVRTYTVHLGIPDASDAAAAAWERVQNAVDELLPAAEKAGIILALENLGESVANLEKLAEVVASYHHPSLGICFDTGHANCYSKLGLFGTLDLLKPHIVTTHMHDNYGTFDDHNPPGDGNSDWPRLIAELKSCPRLCHAETESGDWSRSSWDKFHALWQQY